MTRKKKKDWPWLIKLQEEAALDRYWRSIYTLIGILIIISSAFKIYDQDNLELYIYQITPLNFTQSSILSRLIPSFELLVGITLVWQQNFRFVKTALMAMVLVQAGLMLSQLYGLNKVDCYCLSEASGLNPLNILLIDAGVLFLLYLFANEQSYVFPLKWLSIFKDITIFIVVVIPFIYSPPDIFTSIHKEETQISLEHINEARMYGKLPKDLFQGKVLLALYEPDCKYCQLASTRLSTTFYKYNIPPAKMHVAFKHEFMSEAAPFYNETNSYHFSYSSLPSMWFYNIVRASTPTIVLLDHGKVVKSMNYRQIDDGLIAAVLLN